MLCNLIGDVDGLNRCNVNLKKLKKYYIALLHAAVFNYLPHTNGPGSNFCTSLLNLTLGQKLTPELNIK